MLDFLYYVTRNWYALILRIETQATHRTKTVSLRLIGY